MRLREFPDLESARKACREDEVVVRIPEPDGRVRFGVTTVGEAEYMAEHWRAVEEQARREVAS